LVKVEQIDESPNRTEKSPDATTKSNYTSRQHERKISHFTTLNSLQNHNSSVRDQI